MSKQVELEPYAPLTRVLGRNHRFVFWKEKKSLALETADFARQCVQLYESITDRTVKPQHTPHLDISTLPASDDESRGQLADSAARILMKVLWLARLSRPDLLVAVSMLASHVCCWSTNDDRRVARLIGYISNSMITRLSCRFMIHHLSCILRFIATSDFAGCVDNIPINKWICVSLRRPSQLCAPVMEQPSSEGCLEKQ